MSSILPAVFTGVAFLIALRRLPALHPLQPWAGSWAVATLLYALRLLPYRNLSWLTAALICGAIVAFAGGVPLGMRIARRHRVLHDARKEVPSIALAARMSIGLVAVILPVYLAQLISRFGFGPVLSLSPEVKYYVSNGAGPLSAGYVYVVLAATALCALTAARATAPRSRRRWLIAAAGCAATVYFSTSRGYIVVALIAGATTLLTAQAKVDWRRLLTPTIAAGVVILGMYIGLGSQLGKTYGNSTIGEWDNFFSRHPAVNSLALPYQDLSASIPALDLLVEVSPTTGIAHGCATAPPACGVIRKLGVPVLRVPVAGPFTKAPLPWNGYTFLDRFLIDGGVVLTLVLVTITGVVAGYFWARSRAGSTSGVLIYAISFPAFVAAYRQNLFQIVFVSCVLCVGLLLVSERILSFRGLRAAALRWPRAVTLLKSLVPNLSQRTARVKTALVPEQILSHKVFRPTALRWPRDVTLGKGSVPSLSPSPTRVRDAPERIDVGRVPKTKEECEHFARYVWASALSGGEVLDVACGTGHGASLLARRARVSGVDRDPQALDMARSRVAGTFVVAEVPHIPFPDDAFDFVVSFETVEHIPDDAGFVREIERVLRPGGTLLISTPNADISAPDGAPLNQWHVREYTLTSLIDMVGTSGLKVFDVYAQSFPPTLKRCHRIAWRLHGLTWKLPVGVRLATRGLFGDAEVRRLDDDRLVPGYWIVCAKKRLRED